MRKFSQIFESNSKSFSDSYHDRKNELTRKFNSDIAELKKEFKDKIDECFYYFTDNFECSFEEADDYYFWLYYTFRLKTAEDILNFKNDGYCVDIGSNHSIISNNTYVF